MAKGEKVKSKYKPPPPPSDISSSDISDSSSDDGSSDEEINYITKKFGWKDQIIHHYVNVGFRECSSRARI